MLQWQCEEMMASRRTDMDATDERLRSSIRCSFYFPNAVAIGPARFDEPHPVSRLLPERRLLAQSHISHSAHKEID